jgi:ElaB/YqjD/DUF883 family membrane-anchored ribosome-binding protein
MADQHRTDPGSRHERSREELNETARKARDAGEELREEAVHEVREAVQEARQQAKAYADARRAAAAEDIADVAYALHVGAQALDERDKPGLADYSNTAAAGAEKLADWVRDKSLADVWHEAEAYARRQPLVTFGGALAAGFVLARFLRSSTEGTQDRAHAADSAHAHPPVSEPNVPDPDRAGPDVHRPLV